MTEPADAYLPASTVNVAMVTLNVLAYRDHTESSDVSVIRKTLVSPGTIYCRLWRRPALGALYEYSKTAASPAGSGCTQDRTS